MSCSFTMVFVDEIFKVNAMVYNNLSRGTLGTCHVPNVEKISIKFNKDIIFFIDLKFFIMWSVWSDLKFN